MARARPTNRESDSMKLFSDCKYFINGHCRSGETCRYRHSLVAKNQLGLCYRWPDHCRNVNCRYRHPIVSTQAKETTSNPPRGAPIRFFWDIESVPIPKRQRPFDIVQRIRRKLVIESDTKEVSFSCYGNISLISEDNQTGLKDANVSLDHVPDRQTGAADRQILLDLDRFERNQRPPATVVLISGDMNFIGKLSDLRHQAGFYVIVIHNTPASGELEATVNAHYSWDSFTNGQNSSFDHSPSVNNNQRTQNSNSGQTTSASSLKKSRSGPSMSDRKANDNLRHSTSLTSASYAIQQQPPVSPVHYPPVDPIPISIPMISQPTFPVYYHTSSHTTPQGSFNSPVFPYGPPPTYSSIYNSSEPVHIPLPHSQHSNNGANPRRTDHEYSFQNCPSCGEEFKNTQALQQHQEAKGHLFVCQTCSQDFYLHDSLIQHQRAKHVNQSHAQRSIPRPRTNNRSRANRDCSNQNNLPLVSQATPVGTISNSDTEFIGALSRGIMSLTRELFQ